MAAFTIGRPITTTARTITVDAGLPVGSHRFQLVVVDSAGNRSRPDVAVVTVQRVVTPPIRPDVVIRNAGGNSGPL